MCMSPSIKEKCPSMQAVTRWPWSSGPSVAATKTLRLTEANGPTVNLQVTWPSMVWAKGQRSCQTNAGQRPDGLVWYDSRPTILCETVVLALESFSRKTVTNFPETLSLIFTAVSSSSRNPLEAALIKQWILLCVFPDHWSILDWASINYMILMLSQYWYKVRGREGLKTFTWPFHILMKNKRFYYIVRPLTFYYIGLTLRKIWFIINLDKNIFYMDPQ